MADLRLLLREDCYILRACLFFGKGRDIPGYAINLL